MSDVLDSNGLALKKLSDIVAELESGMKTIFGDDINVDSDSPDGQMINLFAQAATDLREVIQDVYTSFDPDQAQGTVLDQRVVINGIKRSGGTYTVTPVNITVDRNVSLVGLDGATTPPANCYTVKDDAGNQFYLVASTTLASGTHSLSFRAANIGAVTVTLNTITTAVTAIAGVTAINNTSSVTTQGVDEESDAALRTRRKRSTSISSSGYTDSIEAAVLALSGVTACICTENVTGSVDANGTPAHSIWVIVEGGTDADIAAAIYAKRSAGCGMRGDVTISVIRTNGRTIDISFDRPGTENLYIRFNIILTTGGTIDTGNLKTLIVQNNSYEIGESASGDMITCYLKDLNQNYRITGMELSKDNSNWSEVVTLSSIANKFVLDTSRISIS